MDDWQQPAARMADATVHPSSRWRRPLAAVPRHLCVPNWWQPGPDGWQHRSRDEGRQAWLDAAYSGRTLVTRVGGLHADHAKSDDRPQGLPTSSATLPALLVQMYQHAMLTDDCNVLATCGTGYGTALLARRLAGGSGTVTSVDIDPYLTEAARERLATIGAHEDRRVRIETADLTGALPAPGRWDRIVATVSVPGIPPAWLDALGEGGRLVTTLAGTGLLIAADKAPSGGAHGRIVGRASFMTTRAPGEHDYRRPETAHAWTAEGDQVATGRYPVLPVAEVWDMRSMMALAHPGIAHSYDEDDDGVRTAVMVSPDGSWARASGRRGETPRVHQTGPSRLWDTLDGIRHDAASDGDLPIEGASVVIDPDGTTRLARGTWRATIPPAPPG